MIARKDVTRRYAILLPKHAGITRSSASGIGQMKLGVVEILPGGSIKNPGQDEEFSDLQISCQWDDPSRYANGSVYAFQIRYTDIFAVELRDARRMAKLLERVERKRTRWNIEPSSFGQFVAQIAADLKLSALQEDRTSVGGSSYSDNDYHTLNLRALQFAIDAALTTAREKETVQS